MLLRLFRSNQPYTVFFTLLLCGVSSVLAFLNDQTINTRFSPLLEHFTEIFPAYWLFNGIAVFVLLFSGAVIANRLFLRNEFTPENHHLSGMWFVIMVLPVSGSTLAIPMLIASLFLMLSMSRILVVFRQPRVLSHYFECGFWMGLSSLIYLPYTFMFAPLVISILYTRSINWREISVPLIGGVLPWFYLFALRFLYDQPIITNKVLNILELGDSVNISWVLTLFGAMLLVFSLYSLLYYLPSYQRSSNKSKNTKSVFLIFILGMLFSAYPIYLGFPSLMFFSLTAGLPVLLSFGSTKKRKDLLPRILLTVTLLPGLFYMIEKLVSQLELF